MFDGWVGVHKIKSFNIVTVHGWMHILPPCSWVGAYTHPPMNSYNVKRFNFMNTHPHPLQLPTPPCTLPPHTHPPHEPFNHPHHLHPPMNPTATHPIKMPPTQKTLQPPHYTHPMNPLKCMYSDRVKLWICSIVFIKLNIFTL